MLICLYANQQISQTCRAKPTERRTAGANAQLLPTLCRPAHGANACERHRTHYFFYNLNIHPKKEYEIRKEENICFAKKMRIPFVDADNDVQNWFARVQGMEHESERGIRCTACFDMRFERTALYAHEHSFKVITSSLGISRWKDMEQINQSGLRAASRYPEVDYWTYNWRKLGGSARMYEIAKREEFYAQQYCGCIYSLRDTNTLRQSQGREKIEIGETWYAEQLQKDS